MVDVLKQCPSCEKRLNGIIALEIIESFRAWLAEIEDPENLLGEVLDQPDVGSDDETLNVDGERYPVICEACFLRIKKDFEAYYADYVL